MFGENSKSENNEMASEVSVKETGQNGEVNRLVVVVVVAVASVALTTTKHVQSGQRLNENTVLSLSIDEQENYCGSVKGLADWPVYAATIDNSPRRRRRLVARPHTSTHDCRCLTATNEPAIRYTHYCGYHLPPTLLHKQSINLSHKTTYLTYLCIVYPPRSHNTLFRR